MLSAAQTARGQRHGTAGGEVTFLGLPQLVLLIATDALSRPSQDHVIAAVILPGNRLQSGLISRSNSSRSAQLCPAPAAAVPERMGARLPAGSSGGCQHGPAEMSGLFIGMRGPVTGRPSARCGHVRFHPRNRGVCATIVTRLPSSTPLRGRAIISLQSAIRYACPVRCPDCCRGNEMPWGKRRCGQVVSARAGCIRSADLCLERSIIIGCRRRS